MITSWVRVQFCRNIGFQVFLHGYIPWRICTCAIPFGFCECLLCLSTNFPLVFVWFCSSSAVCNKEFTLMLNVTSKRTPHLRLETSCIYSNVARVFDYMLITAGSGFLYMNASESECIRSGYLTEPQRTRGFHKPTGKEAAVIIEAVIWQVSNFVRLGVIYQSTFFCFLRRTMVINPKEPTW